MDFEVLSSSSVIASSKSKQISSNLSNNSSLEDGDGYRYFNAADTLLLM